MAEAHAQTVRLDIVEEIEFCLKDQVRLAKLLEGQIPRKDWEYQAKLLLRDHPGFLAEQWVDPASQVRWSVVESTGDANQSILRGPEASLQSRLMGLTDRREKNATFTPPFHLWDGKSARRIVVPVYRHEQLSGFSIATVEREKLFEKILEDQAGAGYGIVVSDENEDVYKTGIAIENEGKWERDAEFDASGLKLRARVWPEASLLTGNRTMLIEISLAAGSLVGLLLFAALDFAAASLARSEELRQARDGLELRVQGRTKELIVLNEELKAEIRERKHAQESLQELSAQLLRLRDAEQRRIGRELHDGVVQTLCALAIYLERLQIFNVKGDRSRAQKLLAMSAVLAEQAIAEVRTISYLLHPPILEDLGLEAVLPWYAAGFAARSGIHTTVNVQPDLGRLPQEVELTLYRIVQEALTNIHRHSGSPTADISLLRDINQVKLQITDHGRGAPSEVLAQDGNSQAVIGVGIAGMRERVRQLRGSLQIQSGVHGTSIEVTLPIEDEKVPEQEKNCLDRDTVQAS
jgi:signal transduction histidine kinase